MKFSPKSLLISFIYIISIFSVVSSQAQITLSGSYVATKVSYLSDEELPEDNILKYTYVKYTFSNQDRISVSGVYYEKGVPYMFTISGDRLIIKSEAGSVMNTMKIMENTGDKLVLVSGSSRGPASQALEDAWAIKYTLYKEEFIQDRIPLSPDDIFSIKGLDTIYKSGQKIYAQFNGPSFQAYVYQQIRNKKMEVKSGELLTTFIIDMKGRPDSLKIIQGINPTFDKEYISAFNSARNMWQPAKLHGKGVKVLMNQSLKYLTSEQALPAYFNAQKALIAYNDKDYEVALYYYDRALQDKDDDIDNLYRRGICKQILGNLKGACADWTKIHLLGKNQADELLLKYCK